MTSVLTSASQATINVFDTISTTANAATKLVTGISTGANMFERMMTDMDSRHAMRSKLDNQDYEHELLAQYSDRITERELHHKKKMQENQEYAKSFAETYSNLQSILHPKNPE